MTVPESTSDLFVAHARRLADDIRNETRIANGDQMALHEIAVAANQALQVVADARTHAEDAKFTAWLGAG